MPFLVTGVNVSPKTVSRANPGEVSIVTFPKEEGVSGNARDSKRRRLGTSVCCLKPAGGN